MYTKLKHSQMKLPTITRLTKAVESAMYSTKNPGFCVSCGASAHRCEPDMEHGLCEKCGENQVFGAEQCMLLGFYR